MFFDFLVSLNVFKNVFTNSILTYIHSSIPGLRFKKGKWMKMLCYVFFNEQYNGIVAKPPPITTIPILLIKIYVKKNFSLLNSVEQVSRSGVTNIKIMKIPKA